jgi:hypothetical protein
MALHALDAYSVADPSLKLLGGETVWHKDIGATTKMIAANENVMNTVKAQYVRKYGSYLGSSLYGWHIFGQMKASALF